MDNNAALGSVAVPLAVLDKPPKPKAKKAKGEEGPPLTPLEALSLDVKTIQYELGEMKRLLDTVARLACPVCAKGIIAEIHPEAVSVDSGGDRTLPFLGKGRRDRR